VRAHLYPPLLSRLRLRPVSAPIAQGGSRAAVAAVLRDLYSPALDLRPTPRGGFLPVIVTPRPYALEPGRGVCG